jgi:peptide/nickel transport system substrate-binding protein
MNLYNKSKQMAIFLVFILLFTYLSFFSSPENVYSIGTSFSNEISLATTDELKTTASHPQVLRVINWNNMFTTPLSYDSLVSSSVSPSSFIFDTLVDYDFETGTIIPSLAQSWVVTNDSKKWLFILREDIVFHDGSKFNASVVKYNYDRLIDPSHPVYVSTPNISISELPLESVDVINDYRVTFNFSKPFASFIDILASKIELASPNSFHNGSIANPIGTGPYKFSQPVIKNNKTSFIFTRNSDYFRGFPPFEQVNYTAYTEFDDFYEPLRDNEVDLAPWGANFLEKNSDYWNFSFQDVGTIHLGWLNQQREEFTNPKVRQAINYAIDKIEYMNQPWDEAYGYFWDENEISRSIIPRFFPYNDDSIPGFPYNVTKANELLDEAGYPRGPDGYRFSIEILEPVNSNRTDYLVGYLDVIGINCTISSLPWENTNVTGFWERFISGDYEMTILGWASIHDLSFMTHFLHSNGAYNTANYSNPVLDSFLDLSTESPVHQEREYYFKMVQNITQEDAPYVLLPESLYYYPRANHVIPFVRLSKNGRLCFNIEEGLPSDVISYSDIDIFSESLYFPFADALISQSGEQSSIVNLTMTHNLEVLFPSSKGTGKFYQVTIGQEEMNNRFRCYYDPDEILDLSLDQFYRYNERSRSWIPVKVISSNSSLRYLEVELPGGSHLLSFGKQILLITYRFLPIITILFGSVLFFAVVTLFYNQLRINQFKRRYNL